MITIRVMGRPTNTKQRKSQIIEGLMKAMSRHGYGGASIQKIAAEASVAPGVIHYHFKSKQDILLALVEQITQKVEERTDRFLANANTPRMELEAVVDAYLATGHGASPDSVAAWVVIGSEALRQQEVRKLYRATIRSKTKKIESLCRSVLKAEGRNQQAAPNLAAGLVSLMEGSYLIASTTPGILPKGYAATAAHKLIAGYLGE